MPRTDYPILAVEEGAESSGADGRRSSMLSYVSAERRAPKDHRPRSLGNVRDLGFH